ncbi:NUDIX domain-containing protein [Pseudomonas syringae]|nr:NUDIX domain-containing protein [Pseudomonas syringae]MBD8577256.1 NUDIX domain-containing protein [Pseudomonas syringae]MBD8790852.1 NUDIX domain-containing protein [Pseudomonas syringae]MBD8802012.1 NUDIX domain-containing protein [Pseudomonas syringae]MBD8811638.1 NUDIX domain-containing protein [Pseudomonas syringae]
MGTATSAEKSKHLKRRATVIYCRDDEILFVRKRKAKWNLPGGRVERGETPKAAALREMAEETGLEFSSLTFVSTYREAAVIHFIFEARRAAARKPRPCNEIDDCRWLSVKQLCKRDIRAPIRSLLKRCAADLERKLTLH